VIELQREEGRAMEWQEDLSVGDAQLDADHRSIFELIDHVQSAAESELDSTLVETALDQLVDYTDRHFAREEAFMRRIGYPDVERHHDKHQALINRVRALQDRLGQEDENVGEDLVVFLNDWWYVHIVQEDMAFKRFAENKPV
jgi:hemerythrin